MKRSAILIAVLSLFLITSCASVQPQQPDPTREEIAVLQKQLLELQRLQNETKAKLDESNETINNLSLKLKALDRKQPIRPIATPPKIEPKPTTAKKKAAVKSSPAAKKKPAKKTKKKIRRQE